MPTYTFSVNMTCQSCCDAVSAVLSKELKGGETFNIDLAGKNVTINSNRPKEELVELIKRSGKSVSCCGM